MLQKVTVLLRVGESGASAGSILTLHKDPLAVVPRDPKFRVIDVFKSFALGCLFFKPNRIFFIGQKVFRFIKQKFIYFTKSQNMCVF